MDLIKFFFLLPKKGSFLQGFANEQLKSQADLVWRQIYGISGYLLVFSVLLGIALAAYYYTVDNEQPGRHYKVSRWILWMFISSAVTFIGTLILEYVLVKTNLKRGIMSLYCLCAINNAIYCLITYFITSFVWCNCFRTNAYKFLKLKR